MREFGFTWTEVRSLRLYEVNALTEHLNKEARRQNSERGTVHR